MFHWSVKFEFLFFYMIKILLKLAADVASYSFNTWTLWELFECLNLEQTCVYEQITENVTKQHITPSLLELHGHVGVQNVVLLWVLL